ncbi:MAG: alcohol dehydrogenase catalytic domain-containing protein [Planctomycetia bacterium]|nr:alcohol dehydrogenase catalytic domain-containing protein [Planctomycetia bacterium]
MKAAVLRQLKQSLVIEDVPVPEIGPDEVLVETHSCGICRTDLHIQDGLAYVPGLPHIPGHEPAGLVAAIGSRVGNIQVGQRVVPHLFVTCGQCSCCRGGRDAQCMHVAGVLGVTLPGAFAEYFAVPARNLLMLPDNVGFDAGGLVSCAVVTAMHAYRRARIGVNDTVVVLGAGGIGLILIQLLKAAGAKVVVVSRAEQSLRMAAEYDADLMLLADAPDCAEQIREFSSGEGSSCVFECVGTGATMQAAASFAASGGQIIVIGEEPEFPRIETIQIAQRELEIIGSRNGSRQDAADALEMISAGTIRPPIVQHVPLEEINEAFDFIRSGQAHGRIVVILK